MYSKCTVFPNSIVFKNFKYYYIEDKIVNHLKNKMFYMAKKKKKSNTILLILKLEMDLCSSKLG